MDQRLSEKCERLKVSMTDHEREIFFGMYVNSAKDFKFLRGDRLLILDIADGLNRMYESKGAEGFAKYFEAPKRYKIGKNDTNDFPFGIFYGKKYWPICKTELSKDELAIQFFPRLRTFFKPYSKLPVYRAITEDIVKIAPVGNGFRADVICVYCPANDCDIEPLIKRYSVQIDKANTCNFSNFRKHMQLHIKNVCIEGSYDSENVRVTFGLRPNNNLVKSETTEYNTKESTPNGLKQIERSLFIDVNELESLPIIIEDDDQTSKLSNQNVCPNNVQLKKIFYDQFAHQNLKLIQSAFKNEEPSKFMTTNFGDRCMNINVIKVKAGGNCFYYALAHQLYYIKINSKDHLNRAKELRLAVVEHMIQNIERYVMAIAYRRTTKVKKLHRVALNLCMKKKK